MSKRQVECNCELQLCACGCAAKRQARVPRSRLRGHGVLGGEEDDAGLVLSDGEEERGRGTTESIRVVVR